MSNYLGHTRSNYFAVKDGDAFLAELAEYPVDVYWKEENGETLYNFMDRDDNGAGDVWTYYDSEGNALEIPWTDVFARHLKDGWVAVLMHVGAEKYHYLLGDATAYNSKGESRRIAIDQIYELASDLGANCTRATY